MRVRQRALDLCVEIQELQAKLAGLLRGTRLYEMAEAQINDTQALESMLIPEERVARRTPAIEAA